MTDQRRNDLFVRLLDALERYYQHVSADDEAGRRVFDEVSAWFERSDAGDRHGFEWICTTLDLDPRQIRTTLEKRHREIRGPRVIPGKP